MSSEIKKRIELEIVAKWIGHSEVLEHAPDGLRKAGLEVAPEKLTSPDEGS